MFNSSIDIDNLGAAETFVISDFRQLSQSICSFSEVG